MRRERMLVLGIVGSARKKGNSAFLLEKVLGQFGGGFETETIFLSDHDIQPCNGCHFCEKSGSCRIDDDMPGLFERLTNAHAVVLASPSYMGGVTSRTQAFMERTWPLRKGQMAGKIGSYIVVGRRRVGVATAAMEDYFTRLGMTKIPGVLGYAFEPGEIVQDREAVSQSLRLTSDICRCLTPMRPEEREVQCTQE